MAFIWLVIDVNHIKLLYQDLSFINPFWQKHMVSLQAIIDAKRSCEKNCWFRTIFKSLGEISIMLDKVSSNFGKFQKISLEKIFPSFEIWKQFIYQSTFHESSLSQLICCVSSYKFFDGSAGLLSEDPRLTKPNSKHAIKNVCNKSLKKWKNINWFNWRITKVKQ